MVEGASRPRPTRAAPRPNAEPDSTRVGFFVFRNLLDPTAQTQVPHANARRTSTSRRTRADFAAQRFSGRYVGAALPHLPFLDGTFDLVLCAHLLFTYAGRFDFEWHVAACRELVRVSAGEVRLHPVVGPDGRTHPGLPRLRRELKAAGIASELARVDYEFFVGTDTMLVLKKGAAKT